MSLPPQVREEVEAEIGPIAGVRAIGGGCVNSAARVETGGGPVFVKYSLDSPWRMFAVEAGGLEQLRRRSTSLRVPRVLAVSCDAPAPGGWLALEWLEPGVPDDTFAARLGRGLAELHRVPQGRWGWDEDGYIGPLRQPNARTDSWAEFWWSRRLEPQLQLTARSGASAGTPGEWALLERRLPDLLGIAEQEGVSLLHGDLWSGNVIALGGGEAALVDPAVYRGHREVDLAMIELFGGFGSRFRDAYGETWAVAEGYDRVRKYVYQLYYLLVHVNLFGGGYRAQTEAVLRRALTGG